jgi:NTE family protein
MATTTPPHCAVLTARLASPGSAVPPDVHIPPRLGHFGLPEFDRAEEAIHEGEAAVERVENSLADAMDVLTQRHQVGENEPL